MKYARKMSKTGQEGYQTLGWILNESEQGLYLAVADEKTHARRSLMDLYKNVGDHS